MTSVQLALALNSVAQGQKTFYARTSTVPDFTAKPDVSLVLSSRQGDVAVPLSPGRLLTTLGILQEAVLDNPEATVLAWGIKGFFSWVRFFTGAPLAVRCRVIDLKPLEAFLGLRDGSEPKTLGEALGRAKTASQDPQWDAAREMAKAIYTPLQQSVIPEMEATGVLFVRDRLVKHACYEIEGTTNGRLTCTGAFRAGYNAHTLAGDAKEFVRARGTDEWFLTLDFRHMEVSMLHWLTQDARLGQVLALEEDFYKVVYKLLTGGGCDSDRKRRFAKACVLNVMYGQSAQALAADQGVSLEAADKIIARLHGLFPEATAWLTKWRGDEVVDFFGRRRVFAERHKIPNFLVQAPAAIVNLEKLINLAGAIASQAKLIANVHDDFVLSAPRAAVRTAAMTARETLMADSRLCPGLRLKVSCRAGPTLAALTPLET